MDTCLAKHRGCSPSQTDEDPRLPTRVVHIGDSDSETHLFVTEGARAKYATLSHCWGAKKTPLVTTRANFDAHTTSIRLGADALTFRQAAQVTRRLGLRYLWIDSLCIIQDSRDDWAREAARMSSVYNNGTVCLAAGSESPTSPGLFPSPHDRARLNPFVEIPCAGADGTTTSVRVRPRCGDPSTLAGITHSAVPTPESLLSSRGWVTQEHRLSPRILTFSAEEMSWVCSTLSRCECRIRPGKAPSNVFRQKDQSGNDEPRVLNMEWPLMVAEFTRKGLTYPEDRLPALAGLAGWHAGLSNDEYLFGMWRRDLAFQLAWYREPDGPSSRFGRAYAPTWSWASTSGVVSYYGRWVTQFGVQRPGEQAIKFDTGEYEPVKASPLTIMDVRFSHTTPNVYGPGEGAIDAFGYLLPVRYDAASERWMCTTVQLEHFDPSAVEVMYDVASEVPEVVSAASCSDGFAMLFVGTLTRGFTIVGHAVVCLLLRRVVDNSPVYRRYGLVIRAGHDDSWRATVRQQRLVLV